MSKTSSRLVELYKKLDETEQLIFMAGLRALAFRVFDIDEYLAWTQERFDRHHAGEKLLLSDLETPLDRAGPRCCVMH